ncbi:MAG: hypothetical protein FWC79_07280 [Oscillospiraceae bacterium]|nr:hypothetical protein [Oscillospiraceae bacterium]
MNEEFENEVKVEGNVVQESNAQVKEEKPKKEKGVKVWVILFIGIVIFSILATFLLIWIIDDREPEEPTRNEQINDEPDEYIEEDDIDELRRRRVDGRVFKRT